MLQSIGNSVLSRILSIAPAEVSCERRGFLPVSLEAHRHIENIGHAFLVGYNAGLRGNEAAIPGQVETMYSGFAFEGAAMAIWLLDRLSLTQTTRWEQFLLGLGRDHPYVVHVGVGWACARLPWIRHNPEIAIRNLDPLLKWLVIDGIGFHEGYFHWQHRHRLKTQYPSKLSSYGRRVFDQGLGRSLWFVEGADVVRIANTIHSLERSRQPDFWSGFGIASAYAGTLSVAEIEYIMASAGPHLGHYRQGVTFGAEARVHGAISNDHTERICFVLCGMNAQQAAGLARCSRPMPSPLSAGHDLPAYEIWRQSIRNHFTCA
eukprot:TRINITY_DN1128_c0_g1_i4.p1 TRINITY_DN1128_c0_g1~~TRINITY_DN1128_c0_g1_i4.p1  ORF type:complete len:319 (+),score=12.28 TRINITY_DN1128_c0_g1_i4:2412-3368(+)